MKYWSAHSLPRPSRRIAVALVAAAMLGCVTKGTHDRVVTERNRLRSDKSALEERVELLNASNESLGSERLELIGEMEDLRETHSSLEVDVRRLRRAEADLIANLARREAELASRSEEIDRLRGTYEGLVADLESEVATGQIQIEQLREGLRLNLTADVLFPSGSAELNASGISVLSKVSSRLGKLPHEVEVRGHTDNVPITGALAVKYPTNWELAGARASRVVRLLSEKGVNPDRLRSVSLSEYAPIGSNETPEGRAQNRRIEITLHPIARTGEAPGEESAAP